MSEKITAATLKGYRRQVIPKGLHDLNTIYSRVGGTGVELGHMGAIMRDFDGINDAKTSDNYSWFWSLRYTLPHGKVAVLLPWALDRHKQDGLRLDRSIAVYISGQPSMARTDGLVEKLIWAFEDIEKKN